MVSVRGILSHGGLRKGNPDSKVMTGFYRSPGIAENRVKGVHEGGVVGRIIDQELLAQREALTNPCEQLQLDGSKVVLFEQVHVIPEALATQLLGGRREQPSQNRRLVPLGECPLAFGPDGAVDGGEEEIVAHRQ